MFLIKVFNVVVRPICHICVLLLFLIDCKLFLDILSSDYGYIFSYIAYHILSNGPEIQ